MEAVPDRIEMLLRSASVHYERIDHGVASSAAEIAELRGTPLEIGGKSIVMKVDRVGFCVLAIRASDVDVVWIYGYGFPVHRGGPMFYADRVGAKTIYEAMSRLYDAHGEMLKPAPLLAELARSGKGFGDL